MAFDVQGFLAWLIPLVQAYGALSVFIAVIVEEIIVPIPSPLVPMAAGFILIPADASFFAASATIVYMIAIPGAIAVAIGSMVIYAVGYYGGERAIKRFRRFLGTNMDKIEKTSKKLEQGSRTWITIAVLRAVPIFPTSIVSLAAGIMHLSAKKFFLSTLIGAIPRMFILSVIGWQFGSTYIYIAEKFDVLENVIFVLAIALAVAGLYYFIKRRVAFHYSFVRAVQ